MKRLLTGLTLAVALSMMTAPFWVPAHAQENLNARSWVYDLTSWFPQRMAALATYPVSTTLTSRGILGAGLVEKPARWTADSNPASGSQGTASIAAEANVRHVADCVSWSADSSAAVTAAVGTFVIRDGATGAGTIIRSFAVAHQVAAGAGVQTIPPFAFCGLNLAGTTNTAMTAEFNAGVTGEVQAAGLTGFNVQ